MSYSNKDKLRQLLLLLISITGSVEGAMKLRYASAKDCDRYSLDAVYNEKFKVITTNVLKDCKEFVNKVSDTIAESLTTIMADLPDRDVSDVQEQKIFAQFRALKNTFSRRVRKMEKNITQAWEALMVSHFDLMYDNGKSSLADYLKKTKNMTDTYSESRKALDYSLDAVIRIIKGTVRDGVNGISAAAEDALKRNETSDDGPKDGTTNDKGEESGEERLLKKKLEIAEMILKGFLHKVTVGVINRKIDLFKKIDIKPEVRDSVMDDLQFDILLIKNRIMAIIQPDLPTNKGSVDLARRSIYTYWSELAEAMYKEKVRSKHNSTPGGEHFYQKMWSDEEQLIDTLLNLLEIY